MSSRKPTSENSFENTVPSVPEILDLKQLKRIEAVHRGFLYQHLYAVGCLLKLADSDGQAVRVERDEDVEVELQGSSQYLQIKTRAEVLQRSDIAGALERFDEIRDTHISGERPGTPVFRIVSNVPPSAVLLEDLSAAGWPADVQILWPNGPADAICKNLPPVWSDLEAAITWCAEAAQAIPFAAVAPETLVWKLAALVQFAATGSDLNRPDHTFSMGDLPILFEQIVEQLQEFPSVPDDYRPQGNEPNLDDQGLVTIVAGLSGAGKTVWAAQAAQHCAASTAYFDVADLPGPALASSLARELIARFLGGRGGEAGAAILPAASGLEMLSALNHRIEISPAPVIVIDNAHRAEPRDLVAITEACSRLRFVFLVQPWSNLVEAEALFATSTEYLSGWSADTIAEVFAEKGCMIDPATAERWRIATGGMPLFVKNAVSLTASLCDGDAARFAEEVETDSHPAATVQEIILGRVVEILSGDARMALAVLSLSTAPLTRDEANCILKELPHPVTGWGRAMRHLGACGALHVFPNGRLKVHDALRVFGRALQSELPSQAFMACKVALRDLLLGSFEEGRDLARFGIWLRLLPTTGEFETLVDVATNDFFHEVGNPIDLKAVLESTVDSDELDDDGRFWTLDALAFWDWQIGVRGEVYSARIKKMEGLVAKGNLGDRERASLAMKQITSAAASGDGEGVTTAFENACRDFSNDQTLMLLIRYNHAVALFQMGCYQDAEREAELLYLEYYAVLGLAPEDVAFANPPQIIEALGGDLDEHQDNLKRLADCLDLYARARREYGLHSGLAWLHALKFYAMANAYRSAVKTGQEAVDDFIAVGDPEGARHIMENNLLPIIQHFDLTTNMVPVCAQYAVTLAYCGEVEGARKEMKRLQAYAGSLSTDAQKELKHQRELIEEIALRLIEAPQHPANRFQERAPYRREAKVGRNDPCPCGSGKKYKKCCSP